MGHSSRDSQASSSQPFSEKNWNKRVDEIPDAD